MGGRTGAVSEGKEIDKDISYPLGYISDSLEHLFTTWSWANAQVFSAGVQVVAPLFLPPSPPSYSLLPANVCASSLAAFVVHRLLVKVLIVIKTLTC